MKVHVIGAGLAGLTSAIRLTEAGVKVALYEAAPQAGGRVRSFFDDSLGCVVDNGTHLLLSGNDRTLAYLDTVGARDELTSPQHARLDFIDLDSHERWSLVPDRGRIPFWITRAKRRVPGTSLSDYLPVLRLATAKAEDTVTDFLKPGTLLYRRLWDPLCVSVLNTAPEEASAQALWPVITATLGRGERYCRPLLARRGLSAAFVDPALAWLRSRNVPIRLGTRLDDLETSGNRVSGLLFANADHIVPVSEKDRVILAMPSHALKQLLPRTPLPDRYNVIANVHYRLPDTHPVTHNGDFPMSLLRNPADWMFVNGQLVSLTISNAGFLNNEPADALAARLWTGTAQALELQGLAPAGSLTALPCPPFRVIRERRATMAQTPGQMALRQGPRTLHPNVFLAGDWTDTGLPSTIEGAVRSGETAAALVQKILGANGTAAAPAGIGR
ncbi:FAD-dependent oxidoreductase [Phaeovibrio sulfidiphilus]|uniref:FAD-dependent oxidoreductase n=1 Tax=Phaeovibrio sulfidiphilus TaxID=1220600 RepID=A0A8J6YMM4_9PROT|nr:hydroxysqualene dehydroxylase HpnE [Phaeovibrio sulfidiphilus]MBE1236684.1 FAD-dependent oxidoreductase [Phaeovibrio sulfidiphilus]